MQAPNFPVLVVLGWLILNNLIIVISVAFHKNILIISKLQVTFYEDPSSLKWTSCLAHGSTYFSIPTGFEWLLLSFEFLIFSVVFRFTSLGVGVDSANVYLSVGLAFLGGRAALMIRSIYGSWKLSETALIDDKFLL